jgi:hypothetical protein
VEGEPNNPDLEPNGSVTPLPLFGLKNSSMTDAKYNAQTFN